MKTPSVLDLRSGESIRWCKIRKILLLSFVKAPSALDFRRGESDKWCKIRKILLFEFVKAPSALDFRRGEREISNVKLGKFYFWT